MTKQKRLIATLALLLANFMGGLDATIINTALPAITSALNGIRLIGWVTAAFLFGTAVTTILWGRVGELIGNKRTFQISVLLFVASSCLGGFSTTMGVLIAMRALMGIGAGGMISIPFIIYARLYPDPAQRARAIGWMTASYTLSTVVGPLIGGWLVDAFSWRWVFFINVPLGILAALMLQATYQEAPVRPTSKYFDSLGALGLIVTLTTLLFASDALATSLPRAGILLLCGLVLAALFYRLEKRRGPRALVPANLLANWSIQSQNLIMFLFNGFFIAYSVYAPLWAQGLLGTSAVAGGLTQIAASILLLVGTRMTARLMGSLPYKRIVMVGGLSILLSAIALVMATKSAPYWWLIVSGGFDGLGMGLAFTPMQISIQDGVDRELMTSSTTFGLLVRTLGETFLAAIFGAVLSLNTKHQLHAPLTSRMVNQLTDPATAKKLPAALLPSLRTILFSGIHLIMLIGLGLVVAALLINWQRPAPRPEK